MRTPENTFNSHLKNNWNENAKALTRPPETCLPYKYSCPKVVKWRHDVVKTPLINAKCRSIVSIPIKIVLLVPSISDQLQNFDRHWTFTGEVCVVLWRHMVSNVISKWIRKLYTSHTIKESKITFFVDLWPIWAFIKVIPQTKVWPWEHWLTDR